MVPIAGRAAVLLCYCSPLILSVELSDPHVNKMAENHYEKMVANGDRLPALVAICSALYSFFHLRLEQMLFELGMSLATITREELRTSVLALVREGSGAEMNSFFLNSFADATFVPMTKYDRPNAWYKPLSKRQAKRVGHRVSYELADMQLKQLRLVGKPVFANDIDANESIQPQRGDHSRDLLSQETFASFESGLAVYLKWELGGVVYSIVKQWYYQSPVSWHLIGRVLTADDHTPRRCRERVSGLAIVDLRLWTSFAVRRQKLDQRSRFGEVGARQLYDSHYGKSAALSKVSC